MQEEKKQMSEKERKKKNQRQLKNVNASLSYKYCANYMQNETFDLHSIKINEIYCCVFDYNSSIRMRFFFLCSSLVTMNEGEYIAIRLF